MEIEHFENQEHEWDSNLKVAEGVDEGLDGAQDPDECHRGAGVRDQCRCL